MMITMITIIYYSYYYNYYILRYPTGAGEAGPGQGQPGDASDHRRTGGHGSDTWNTWNGFRADPKSDGFHGIYMGFIWDFIQKK